MDKSVRVNFFQVQNQSANDITLYQALTDAYALPDRDSFIELFQGVNVRLERVASAGGFVEGDIVRQQTDNIPPIAHSNQPLRPNDTPLGHRSAFLYHPRLNVIAIEANRQGASPARLNAFLRARLQPHRGYYFDPCLTEDALELVRSGTPRKIQLRVARPSDLNAIDGNPYDVEGNLSGLQEMVDGNSVTVEVGFSRGDRDSVLNFRKISEIFRWANRNRGQVEKLKVKTLENEVPIDLLGQQMFEKEVLDIDNNDLDAAYNVRSSFLRGCFNNRMNEIERLYGV